MGRVHNKHSVRVSTSSVKGRDAIIRRYGARRPGPALIFPADSARPTAVSATRRDRPLGPVAAAGSTFRLVGRESSWPLESELAEQLFDLGDAAGGDVRDEQPQHQAAGGDAQRGIGAG